MKIIKDKKKLLKNIDKNFKNERISNVERLLEMITDYYDLEYPEIVDLKNEYDLEIIIKDKNIDTRFYKIILSMDKHDFVLVELSDKNYVDLFKLCHGFIKNNKRIYKNKEKNIIIEKIVFSGNNYLRLEKYHEERIEDIDQVIINTIKTNYEGYVYYFKNSYLNAKIIVDIPLNSPFVENFFIKKIFESHLEITNIDILFYVIKSILNCSKAHIRIENNKERGIEVIDFSLGKLLEYTRITDDKKIEYKDGYKELLITKYESDSLENDEFQKVLKMIRS